MGTTIPLNTRSARFLLLYHTTPHATIEMSPDKLFIHQHLRTHLKLTQPNLAPTIKKHQQQQKQSHDQRNYLVTYSKDESALGRNQRGRKQWVPGRIVTQIGLVTYLVWVDTQMRFCHVDHLLKKLGSIHQWWRKMRLWTYQALIRQMTDNYLVYRIQRMWLA